jgi:hypothetical protein
MSNPHVDPLDNPPAAVLAFLSERQRYDENGKTYFIDDQGDPIWDLKKDMCPPADARGAAWWTRQFRPDLWSNPKAETKVADPAPVEVPTTSAGLMLAVRAGTMTVEDATARMMAARPTETAPAPAMSSTGSLAPTGISALMARVRNGDVGAQAELDRAVAFALSKR